MATSKSKTKTTIDAVSVTVGTASIDNAAHVILMPVNVVRLKLGQGIQVGVTYEFHETSKDREEFSFTLKLTPSLQHELQSQRPRPVVAVRWGDRWGRNDARKGSLKDTFVPDRAGDWNVGFDIEADYARMKWGDSKVGLQDRKTKAGTIVVHVEP